MIDRLTHWLAAHPEMLIHAWPIVTAIFLALVTQRSDEDFDALPAWRQRLILFVKASGLDVRAALNAVKPRGAKSIPPPSKGGERGSALMRPLVVMSAAFLAGVFGLCSCALFTAQNAKTALNIAQATCIVTNAMLPDQQVAKVCGVIDDAAPAMKDLLRSQRMAVARRDQEMAAACGDDAFRDLGADMDDAGHD
jgi:hypothetical protein